MAQSDGMRGIPAAEAPPWRRFAGGLGRGLKSFLIGVKMAADFLVSLFWFAVGAAIIAVIWSEVGNRAVVVENITVPAELEARGYTPSVVAYNILDEWRRIDEEATTTRPRPELSLASGRVDLSLPGVNISIGSIIDYFRARLGYPQRRLRGAIVVSGSAAAECAEGCYDFHVDLEGHLRNRRAHIVATAPQSEINRLISTVALQAGEHIDPYLLANFYYAQEDPALEQRILQLVDTALRTPPADDEPWAHTLAGAMMNRNQRWAEAIPHFDRALARNPRHASALNSRCWARAHLAGQAGAAIRDCRAALRLMPESEQTMHSLAFALEQSGDRGAAFETIRCARRLAPHAQHVSETYERLRAALPHASDRPATAAECAAALAADD